MARDTELERQQRVSNGAQSGDGNPAPPAQVPPQKGRPQPSEAEEYAEGPKRSRARSYFDEHPKAKYGLVALVLVFVVTGLLVWRHYAGKEATDDAQIDGHLYPVSARVAGTAIQINFEENTLVQAAQVLAQLDRKDYEVALARAQAELSDAEAQAVAAHTGVPLQRTGSSSQLAAASAALKAAQAEAAAAAARVREAEANYNRVATDLKRYQLLVQKDEISRQLYDATVAAEQAAKATLDAAHSSAGMSESKVVQAEADVRAAQIGPEQIRVSQARAGSADAAVERARSAVHQAELNLDYTTVRSPVTGVLSKRNAEPGQVLMAGQPLFSVVNLDDVWVTANFKETQLKQMQVGQSAEVEVDAYGRSFRGHVDSFGGATGSRFSVLPAENASGNYVKVVQRVPVKIVLDRGQDPQHLLRPGMSVNVTVHVDENPNNGSRQGQAPGGGK